MSTREIERKIVQAIQIATDNRKIRMKDLQEWSTTEFHPHEGEHYLHLPTLGVYAAWTDPPPKPKGPYQKPDVYKYPPTEAAKRQTEPDHTPGEDDMGGFSYNRAVRTEE